MASEVETSQQLAVSRLIAPGKTHGVARSAILMVSATVTVAVLNYALNVILGWALPVVDYGRIGVSQTLIFICASFLSAGFPWIVSRSIARAHGAGPQSSEMGEEAWRLYKTAWLANTVLTVILVGLLLGAFYLGWLPLQSAYEPLIVIVAITVASIGVGSVPNAGLQGLFRFGRISVLRILEAVLNIVVSVALIVAGYGAVGALAGFGLSALVANGLAIWLIKDRQFWTARGWGGLVAVRSALPTTVAVFGIVILSNIDVLAVKFLSPPATSDSLSAIYQVAAVLARAPFFVCTALIAAFYPRIAQESRLTHDPHSARQLLNWLGIGVLPMYVILVAGAPAVVAFLYPGRYSGAALVLPVLAAGSAFLALTSALSGIFQATARPKRPAAVIGAAILVQVVLLASLVPARGVVGAALASLAATVVGCLLLFVSDRRYVPSLAGVRQQAMALAWLALLILPLGLFLAEANRVFVAIWVALALALYLAACLVLGLLDAVQLSTWPALPRRGVAGEIVGGLLSVASELNRLGGRLGLSRR